MCLISGRYPMAVITKVDVVNRHSVDTLRSTLERTGISEIFEVANVSVRNEDLEICYQHSLLSLLNRCTMDGDEAAVFKLRQRIARQNREEQRTREKQEQSNYRQVVKTAAGKKYF